MIKLRARRLLILAISATVALVLQVITLIRHVRQQPGDWLTIVVLGLVVAALAFAAIWSAISWSRIRSNRAPAPTQDEKQRNR